MSQNKIRKWDEINGEAVPDEKSESYLKNAEMALEDDYGMIDGIINNGKSPAEEEKTSVLEKLKEAPVVAAPKRSFKHSLERDME